MNTAEPRTESGPLPDQWHYRLGGREHGPYRLAELIQLVGNSGDVASDIEVRQASQGPWLPFPTVGGDSRTGSGSQPGHVPGMPPGLSPSSVAQPSRVPMAARAVRAEAGRFRWRFRDHRDIWIAVAAWIVVNTIVMYGLLHWPSGDERYAAVLRQMEGEIKELRLRNASDTEWNDERRRVAQTLERMVKDLKKTASASDPVRQHLLWAARDQFPKLVGPETSQTQEASRVYQKHMEFVERELGR